MSYLEKKIQYVLFILMVCLLLVPPAVATEALGDTGVNQVEDALELSTQTLVQATEAVILFDGTIVLTKGTFECVAYNSGATYTVPNNTPLGVLQAVAEREGFTYAVTDKRWGYDEVLLLDDIGEYTNAGGKWFCYVNGEMKDGFKNHDAGLNVIELAEGDEIVFCYGENPTPDDADVLIRIIVAGEATGAVILFDGTVALTEGTFECMAQNSGVTYNVPNNTPLGVLQAVAERKGFTYAVTDKKWDASKVLLLDDIGEYKYVKGGSKWVCYVNGVEKDGYDGQEYGLNVVVLVEDDEVIYCYGENPTPDDADVLIRITVGKKDSDDTPTTWRVTLKGTLTDTVSQSYFEQGIAHGHVAEYTDDDGDVWAGMPLWYLVGLVDDEQGHGAGTFNEALAAKGYSIKVTSSDGYSINFDSKSVAKNDDVIVANTLNGDPLPETIGEKNKPCWPLQMIGKDVSAGQKVGGVTTIELIGLPEVSDEWEITLVGAFTRTVSQDEFGGWARCHGRSYTDSNDQVWTGVPLWYLVGAVDDVESGSHWTFNNALVAEGYTVRVTAGDGFNATFNIADIAKNDSFIVANKMNAATLDENGKNWPLKFVGPGLSGKEQVGNIASISLEGLPGEGVASDWALTLEGPKITYIVTKEEFEAGEACPHHTKTYDDGVSTWTGITLKALCGWVDDDIMHGSGAFDTNLALTGYTIIVSSGGDSPYSKEFSSKDIAANADDYIVASKINGSAIDDKNYPLRLVGKGATGSLSIGNVQRIQLVDFQKPTESPSIRIVRYASDGKTVVNETTRTCEWMEENLRVYGEPDGVWLRFQGPTFDPDDLWNPAEDINPGKVDEVVKGTAIRDLCDLVGGVPEGGEIDLIASDGYKATINYTNVYTPLERQGEAIVAWWAERQGYVPDYRDGPRLFYNAPDGVFGADDMRTCLAEAYWHYYWDSGIQYPSAAGVSNKNIATIAIKPGAREDWSLLLTGAITDTIDRSYFESGKACAMAGHGATWTDDEGQVWSGMPLWVLCGWVDDDNKHDYGTDPFRDDLADAGYNVTVIDYGPDGIRDTDDDFSYTFNSSFVKRNNNIIVADEIDGAPLPKDGKSWPLKLVGDALTSNKQRVGSIDEIVLTGDVIQPVDSQKPTESPSIRIVRYASDGKTVVNETTRTCEWMEENLRVYGEPDGVWLRFQGPTFDPDDLWNPAEDINPGKVDEVVKGTAIRDLCDLVGGVPEGGEIDLIASDGYKATINYTNVYTPLERQGEAIVAWWAERQGYVPDYRDGPRLFYNAPDGVFGADDMRTCLAEAYWHYYWDSGIQYPSAAGVSNKNIATIAIKPGAREDWSLLLTGAITDTIDRSYFESGKACAMAGHGATWTDDEGQVWSGMPLWVLCGWVDDDNKHDYGTDPFRDDLADAGYNVTVIDYGPDGIRDTDDDFSYTFNSSFVKRNNNIIVADEIDGAPLPKDGKSWPLKLVGDALTSNKQRVGSIDEIVLTGDVIVVVPPSDGTAIPLKTGWNFISVPKLLSAGNNTATIFAGVDRADHSIWRYDAAVKDWKRVEDTDRVLPLEGYWVYSAGNMNVPLHFDTDAIRTPPTKMLARGWNAIGFSDTGPATARDTLLSLGDAWTQVIGYDAGKQLYETSIIRGGSGNHADTQEMLPMKGYWVYMRGESELAAIGA